MSERRCPQCWAFKPYPSSFIGRRGAPIRMCSACTAKYRGWDALSVGERLSRIRGPKVSAPSPRGHRVTLSLASGNRKTGRIPVSITDPSSCPPTCAFHGGGCYANYGHLGSHWRSTARRGMPWGAFCDAVAALPFGTVWRHNEAGDLPGHGAELDRLALARLVRANRGRRGFTFTHKPLTSSEDADAVRRANGAGFAINLSADTLEQADQLADRGLGPVVVVLPHDAPHRATRTPKGRKVVVCPAQTSGLTCDGCRLCTLPRRKSVIGFIAHGQSKVLVSELVRARRATP